MKKIRVSAKVRERLSLELYGVASEVKSVTDCPMPLKFSTEKLWTVKDVAHALGMSTKTIYEWVRFRKIPFYKVGRNLRFKKEEVQKHFLTPEKKDE